MMRIPLLLAAALGPGTLMAAQSGPPAVPAAIAPAPAPVPAQAPAPQALGRLFFTPGERAQLDVARLQKKPTQTASPEAEPPPAAPPPPQVVTYGGIVRRSDGKAMLWINNRLVDEKEALSALNLKGRVRPDGAVTLQVPETGATINVRVGQSVEVQTGKVGETRRPGPEAKGSDPQAKAPASDPKSPASEAKPGAQPPADAADRNTEATGSAGLKTDAGGRRLDPSDNQKVTRESSLK